MDEVSCTVEAERVGYRGYGMLLAGIGTPPGADVNGESLQAAIDADWSISRYDVLPDRIIVYMWSKTGGNCFAFFDHGTHRRHRRREEHEKAGQLSLRTLRGYPEKLNHETLKAHEIARKDLLGSPALVDDHIG